MMFSRLYLSPAIFMCMLYVRYFHFYLELPRREQAEPDWHEKGIIFLPLLLASFSPSSGFHSELRLSVCHTFLVSTLQTRSWSAPFKHSPARKILPAIIETQRWWFAREDTDRTTSWCAVVAREGGPSTTHKNHFLVSLWGVYSFEYVKFSAALLRWSISTARIHTYTPPLPKRS